MLSHTKKSKQFFLFLQVPSLTPHGIQQIMTMIWVVPWLLLTECGGWMAGIAVTHGNEVFVQEGSRFACIADVWPEYKGPFQALRDGNPTLAFEAALEVAGIVRTGYPEVVCFATVCSNNMLR